MSLSHDFILVRSASRPCNQPLAPFLFLQSLRLGVCAVLFFSTLLLLPGCKTAPTGQAILGDLDAPDYAEFAQSHNERVLMLCRLYSRGVLEVRWRDADGVSRREPQVDLDLYLMPERRTAFRASKVGEIYLWLGSDEEQFWVFDMTGDERVLYHAAHDRRRNHRGESVALHPLLVRDLMGLAPLAKEDGEEQPSIGYDADHDAWVVTTPSTTPGWRIRLFFDRSSGLPKRAEAMADDERVMFASEIGRYRRATQTGMASVRFPWMPTLVDVTAEEFADGVSRIDVKIALDSPTGRVDDQPMDRVFDLERLKTALRPDRVESP